MRYKYLLALLIVVTVVILLGRPLVLRYWFDKEIERSQPLNIGLAEAIRDNHDGAIQYVDLAAMTDFKWDHVYFFHPYTSPEDINKGLGKNWIFAEYSAIDTSDRIVLIVFTYQGNVVRFTEFSRGLGDFNPVADNKGLPADQARFEVDEDGRIRIYAEQ